MSGHEIVWTFDHNYVKPSAVCNEPIGADCRLGPIKGSVLCQCEEWSGPLRDEDGPYHLVEGSLGEEKHRMEDSGECQVVLFLNESELIEESAVGVPRFVVGRTQIEPVWEGEYYNWKPAEVTP